MVLDTNDRTIYFSWGKTSRRLMTSQAMNMRRRRSRARSPTMTTRKKMSGGIMEGSIPERRTNQFREQLNKGRIYRLEHFDLY